MDKGEEEDRWGWEEESCMRIGWGKRQTLKKWNTK